MGFGFYINVEKRELVDKSVEKFSLSWSMDRGVLIRTPQYWWCMVCPYSHLADESSISLKNEIYIEDPATVINATLLIPPNPRDPVDTNDGRRPSRWSSRLSGARGRRAGVWKATKGPKRRWKAETCLINGPQAGEQKANRLQSVKLSGAPPLMGWAVRGEHLFSRTRVLFFVRIGFFWRIEGFTKKATTNTFYAWHFFYNI